MARKLQPIPEDSILNKMKLENCWWQIGEIDSEFGDLPRRLYFDLFFKLIAEKGPKRAVVLMGPRRVGKTVMMHHAIGKLLKTERIRNTNIAFINVENPLFLNIPLEELFSMDRKASGNEDPKGWYIFFDEIQYLTDWEVHLKVLVDSYPNTKFIVSGSAAAALKLASTESGAGRFTDFMLPPLTFHEYIYLKKLEPLITEGHLFWNKNKLLFYSTNNIELLNAHFVDYINHGGYPEIIFSERAQRNLGRYIKSDIIDKVLLRDLPSLYGIQNPQELNRFFTTLAYYTAQELSLDSLSSTSGVNKHTLKKYLDYLEAAFLIKQIYKIDDFGKRFERQSSYKVYLTNPSLRSALFSPLLATDDAMGHMVENAIFSQWLHRENRVPCYARWNKGEIDMIGINPKNSKPLWAAEIKWSNSSYKNLSEIKNLISFCEKNNLTETVVTTMDKFEKKQIGDLSVNYIPSSIYAYNVGVQTIRLRSLE